MIYASEGENVGRGAKRPRRKAKRRKALTYQTGKRRRINAIIRVKPEDAAFLMIFHELGHSVNYLPLRKYDVDRGRRLLEVSQEQTKTMPMPECFRRRTSGRFKQFLLRIKSRVS